MEIRLKDSVKAIGAWLQAAQMVPRSAARIPSAVLYVLILSLALGLRIHLASIAHPAQSDSTHMIHQGILWAQGEPGALSTIWQEFPVLTSGMAYRLGWNPAEALQGSTVIFGTLLVGLTMLLTRRLFDSDAAAWIAGGWAAANQGLLNFSVNSMPEIGFAACLVGAYAILAPSIRGRGVNIVPLLAAYGLLGLGMYFKPLDSLTAAAFTTGWLALMHLRNLRKVSLQLLAGLTLYVVLVVPHYWLQSHGSEASSLKLANRSYALVYGHRAYDSKLLYSPDNAFRNDLKEFERLGAGQWLWQHRMEVSRRYAANVLISLRIYGTYLFPNAFRLGNAWFIALLAALAATRLCGPLWRPFSFLVLAIMAFPLGVSLSYVYEHWLVIYSALLIVAISGHLVHSHALWGVRWKRMAWILLLVAMMENSAALAYRHHLDQVWRGEHQREIATWLRNMAGDGERIMTGFPSFSLDFDLDHPRRREQLPCGTGEEVDRYAERHGVTYIVLCDSFSPHWPINQILLGAPAPRNWTLIKAQTFKRLHPVWGEQEETYQIYKRGEALSAPPGSGESVQ